jgi:hypothetical protein
MHSAFVAVTLVLFFRNLQNLPCKNRIGFQIVQHLDFGISCTAAKIFLGNAFDSAGMAVLPDTVFIFEIGAGDSV